MYFRSISHTERDREATTQQTRDAWNLRDEENCCLVRKSQTQDIRFSGIVPRGRDFVNDSDEPSVQPRLRTTNLEHTCMDTAEDGAICPEEPQDSKLRGPGRKEGVVRMGLKQGTNLLGGLGMK